MNISGRYYCPCFMDEETEAQVSFQLVWVKIRLESRAQDPCHKSCCLNEIQGKVSASLMPVLSAHSSPTSCLYWVAGGQHFYVKASRGEMTYYIWNLQREIILVSLVISTHIARVALKIEWRVKRRIPSSKHWSMFTPFQAANSSWLWKTEHR